MNRIQIWYSHLINENIKPVTQWISWNLQGYKSPLINGKSGHERKKTVGAWVTEELLDLLVFKIWYLPRVMHLIHGQWDFEWQHVQGNQQQNFWIPGRNYLDTTVWTFRKIQLINQQPTHLKSFTKTPAALGLVMGDFQKCQRLSSVRVLAPWTWKCNMFFSTKIFSEDIGNQALLHEDHPDLSRSNGKNTALDINRKVKAGTWIQSFLTNRTFSSLGKWIKKPHEMWL